MNYFFGVNNNIFKSEVQIPTFQNRSLKPKNIKLFKCYPENGKWILKDISKTKINEYFYFLKNDNISDNEVYFLADEKICKNFDGTKLENFNSFTDTKPAFRANLKIYINNGGFSSYQSEYPYSMIKKRGSILSSVSSLANTDAEKNYIIIKNIFEKPIEEIFKAYFVNYRTKKVEETYQIKTNNTNYIEINKKLIKPEIFFATNEYLGIPIYVSLKNNYLSFEHTHPPHEYILSKNKFVKVNELKKELNEIIN
jgi:hypothetical protein